MRVLFVSRDYSGLLDGGSLVAYRNLQFLKRFAGTVDELVIPKAGVRTLATNYAFKQSYGSRPKVKKRLIELLRKWEYDFAWFDGSHYGGYLERVKKEGIPTICFMHNVECDFYRAKADTTGKVIDRLFLPFIQMNESKSVRMADLRIVLNDRDSHRLQEEYGCRAEFILPTSFATIPKNVIIENQDENEPPYLLFVGSNFYANKEALDYTIKEILPNINNKVKVVGSVCDNYVDQRGCYPENIEFVGRVDNLLPYYANASAIISPILSGAGTKTKTIEALAYGKTIIGSREALMGVSPQYYDEIGALCEHTNDYVEIINNRCLEKFNDNSYNLFKEHYSSDAIYGKFEFFLKTKLAEL